VWLAVMLVSAGFTGLAEVGPGKPIPIILAAPATPAEQIAARSLAQQLGQLYPREKFLRAEALPESGRCILLGTGPQGWFPATGAAVSPDNRGCTRGVQGMHKGAPPS
jgi:hypothetical protein